MIRVNTFHISFGKRILAFYSSKDFFSSVNFSNVGRNTDFFPNYWIFFGSSHSNFQSFCNFFEIILNSCSLSHHCTFPSTSIYHVTFTTQRLNSFNILTAMWPTCGSLLQGQERPKDLSNIRDNQWVEWISAENNLYILDKHLKYSFFHHLPPPSPPPPKKDKNAKKTKLKRSERNKLVIMLNCVWIV